MFKSFFSSKTSDKPSVKVANSDVDAHLVLSRINAFLDAKKLPTAIQEKLFSEIQQLNFEHSVSDSEADSVSNSVIDADVNPTHLNSAKYSETSNQAANQPTKSTKLGHLKVPFLLDGLTEFLAQDNIHLPIKTTTQLASLNKNHTNPLAQIKHIVAVASGKGGVGKSTTSVNLARALAYQGAKVGILDADIYGPSIPIMLGLTGQQPDSLDGKIMQPLVSQEGIKTNSIGFLVDPESAAIWRGPMASKALTQLFNETQWGALDYLIIDLPPGTGDIQLTLTQSLPLSAALIVTTPQNIALADAEKAVAMFNQLKIPVLGLVENMSHFICGECGHVEHIFGSDGGGKLADKHQVNLLGQIPLDIKIRQAMDKGEWVDFKNAPFYPYCETISIQLAWQLFELAQKSPAGQSIPTKTID